MTECLQCITSSYFIYENRCVLACPRGTTGYTGQSGHPNYCSSTGPITAQPTSSPSAPTGVPTFQPCATGTHNCDTLTTYCSSIPSNGASYTCECREGYMHIPTSWTRCIATPSPTRVPTQWPTTSMPSRFPTSASPTTRPTVEPTYSPCTSGTHNCNLTSTYCAAIPSSSGNYTCECLDGYIPSTVNSTTCDLTMSPTSIPTTTFSPTTQPTALPTHGCLSNQFACRNGGICIPSVEHCDGVFDCPDRSDEWGCT